MESRARVLRKQQKVPSGHDPAAYAVRRIEVPTADHEKVPVTVLHRKDLRLDGSAPLLLEGYGAYSFAFPAAFDPNLFSLVDRGFVYAIAHVRGGLEKGERWRNAGRLANKANTFKDFIAVAEHLGKSGYTRPGRIVARGDSAGGLLMGAVANMRPDLYRGIVAYVPFVDVVTTMLDEEIPLTSNEYDEWGDPGVRTYYDYMLSYSPYDQVGARDYPAMLVTTGLWDSQVQYWEPAKWVAKLRALKTDDDPILLHVNMDAGHGGQSGRFRRHRETALEYTFILDRLGAGGQALPQR